MASSLDRALAKAAALEKTQRRYRGSLQQVLEAAPSLADRMLSTKTAYTYEYLYIHAVFYDHESDSSHAYIHVPRGCDDEEGFDKLGFAIDGVDQTVVLPQGYRFSDMRGQQHRELIILNDEGGSLTGYISCLKTIVRGINRQLRQQGFSRAILTEVDSSNSPNGPVFEVECARTMPMDEVKLQAGVKAERRRSSLGQTSKAIRETIKQGEKPPVPRRKKRVYRGLD